MALDITSIPNAKNSQIWVMSALGIAIGLAMFGFYTYRACRKAYTIKQNPDLYLPEKDGTTTTTSLDSCARVAVES
ncbi:hypothetical protein HYE67_005219 [Fusarium culmorum]|uniref:Uncharacterized protein n=1 Tax=Fusarium culmorum TaxID=5516 RepID=A0A2T4GYE6_FUSCU|nr:hypothetical protein FCULG_00012460 [Fusarium culmorum]QPC62988.1 hypothetical protein HYE67_005219 [Fusarium culmorum]